LQCAAAAGRIRHPAVPVHAIGHAGFSVLIIGMITRTALGHLGRPLTAEHSMVASYAFMLLALAFRLAAFIA